MTKNVHMSKPIGGIILAAIFAIVHNVSEYDQDI